MAARSDGSAGGLKSAGVQRAIGIAALVVTALVIGAVRMGFLQLPGTHKDEDALLASGSESAAVSPTRAPTRTTRDDAADFDAPAEEPAASSQAELGGTERPGARAASTMGTRSASVTAVTPDAPRRASVTHLDEHVTYQYNALGRRDPFQSLLTGEFVGADVGGDAPPDPGGIKVVGIVWGATDQFAMIEDVRGNSYVLRKGDKVQNGYVAELRREAVVVSVTTDGQSQQVTIPLVRKGDANVR
jgi:hypothetical protein